MTTGTLAALIFGVILLQLLVLGLVGYYRRKRDYRVSTTEQARPQADTLAQETALASEKASSGNALAWEGFRIFEVIRRCHEDAALSICSFYLAPQDGKPLPDFKPGQFLTFKLPLPDDGHAANKVLVRCYSLSDSPNKDYYRVSIKRVPAPPDRTDLPPGRGSNYFHEQVQVGSHLQVRAPAGHFHLLEEASLPVVLIAGGIGITPMLSILNSLLERGSERQIWLFYGVRDGSEVIMKEQLQALAHRHAHFHLHLCYSRPDEREVLGVDFHHRGRVDVPLLVDTLTLGRYQFYVCGPKAMMESIVPGLQGLGIDSADIHYESFGPASLIKQDKPETQESVAKAAKQMISFSRSGRRIAWDAQAECLLDFAESQGVEVVSGCRAGSCGSCQTPIESGEVEYNQDPDADIEPGHCLLCICKPKGDLSLAL